MDMYQESVLARNPPQAQESILKPDTGEATASSCDNSVLSSASEGRAHPGTQLEGVSWLDAPWSINCPYQAPAPGEKPLSALLPCVSEPTGFVLIQHVSLTPPSFPAIVRHSTSSSASFSRAATLGCTNTKGPNTPSTSETVLNPVHRLQAGGASLF